MSDNIKKMHEYQVMNGTSSSEYVVRGAEVLCKYGSKTCVLNLRRDHGAHTSDGRPLITDGDCKSTNISGFGICNKDKTKPCKCDPKLNDWSVIESKNLRIIDPKTNKVGRAVTQDSITVCEKGGIVSFKTSGQASPSYDNVRVKDAVEIVENVKGTWRRPRDKRDFVGHVKVKNSGLYNFGVVLQHGKTTLTAGSVFVYEYSWGKLKYIDEYDIKRHLGNEEQKFPEATLEITEDSYEFVPHSNYWNYWIDIILYANRDYYFEIDCFEENGIEYKLIGNHERIVSNNIGLVQWTLPYSCENWFAANTGLATIKRYIVYLDEAYAYIFQKALEDEQFIKERKDELKDNIQGVIKTVAITAAGLAETVTGVYLTAIDFMLTIFVESERNILIKQLSEYNSAIGWEGKLIRIIIYEDNRYMSVSDIYNEGRKTEVSWYGKPNKPGDTYIVYGEKYMWGEIKKLKEKSDDLIKATQKFKKEGESVRNIIKSYNFSE
nr:PAAR-like protein [uncultured Lachnoanaerobaculum sp.]